MGDFRYPQFCALARAAEILGERWTLLIIRELFAGPQRFSDIRRRLSDVSPSVLSERLACLETAGIVVREQLDPPAASTVYKLGEAGLALHPAVAELARWGARFLLPPRPGERLEPAWLKAFLGFTARNGPTPRCSYELRLSTGGKDFVIHITGGPQGTEITDLSEPSDLLIAGEALDVAGVMVGYKDARSAADEGLVRIEGDLGKLARFPELFEVNLPSPAPASINPQPTTQGD
ncbi:MAG: winged helix-turn-helix transcriptional regulator [Candidatus Binatia bacterium]